MKITIPIRSLPRANVVCLGIVVITFALTLSDKSPSSLASYQGIDVITTSTDTPDESKSNASAYVWQGSAEQPKEIRVPSQGVQAYIQKMGIDQNGKIAVPSNIHLAGWYTGSTLPNTPGISVIVGHVTGKKEDGIFKTLPKLSPKDTVIVVLGDGTELTYEVIQTLTVKEKDATNFLFSGEPGVAKQLNLITCGGEFNVAQNQYEDRVIVSTKQL